MPDINEDGIVADPQPAPLPAALVPDPLVQKARTTFASVEGPGMVVWLADAQEARDQAVRDATKLVMEELERVADQLIQANEALEAWGAFDYLLLLAAEAWGLTDYEAPPIGMVHAIALRAYRAGRDGQPWPEPVKPIFPEVAEVDD